jgi:hypothetical protein
MEGHGWPSLGFNYHRIVNLDRVRVIETIPSNEISPAITMQTQMMNNDKLNKPMVEQVTVILLHFKPFLHFI